MRQLLCVIVSVAYPLLGQMPSHFDTLKQSSWFAIYGGYANTATAEAQALAGICGQTNAIMLFQRLLQEKGPAQQLYGLLGLRILNAQEFKSALPTLLNSTTTVRVLEGCLVDDREVAEIARQIQNDRWMLRTQPAPRATNAPALIE